jgi:hypothetical protein
MRPLKNGPNAPLGREDINTVRAWLGHGTVDTTKIYAEIDMETKAKALAQCEITDGTKQRR